MSLDERESARRPIWPNTSPSPDSLTHAVEAEAAAKGQLAAADHALRRDRGDVAAVDGADVDGRDDADERADLGAKARHRSEARAEAGHRRLGQRLREQRHRFGRGANAFVATHEDVVLAHVERVGLGRRAVRGRNQRHADPTGRLVDHLREAVADGGRGALGVLRAHVRVAHQHRRVAAAVPGEGFEAGIVVVVVRALALRHVAPGSGDVAGGEGVLEEMEARRPRRRASRVPAPGARRAPAARSPAARPSAARSGGTRRRRRRR